MFGRGQQTGVIRIHFAEPGLGRRRQMDSIGPTQKHGCRQLLVGFTDAGKNVRTQWNPSESASLNVRLHLANQSGIGRSPDGPFAQLAMERGDHFGLPMRCAGQVVGAGERAHRLGARILVIEFLVVEPNEVVSCPRSSLKNFLLFLCQAFVLVSGLCSCIRPLFLYQGTTSVVPQSLQNDPGFSP